MLDGHDLSLFQKILLGTDGTVTDMLTLYAGEPIRVRKLEQTLHDGASQADLDCGRQEQLLNRKILLSGATRNYLYAESLFVFARLSTSIQKQMLETDRPLGRLWKEERLETFREIVDQSVGPCAAIAPYFEMPATALFVSRTYLIRHAARPLGRITEKWPLSHFR